MVSSEAHYFRTKDLFSINRYVLKLAHLTIKQHRSFLTDQIWSRQKLLTDLYLNSITLTKYGLVRGSLLSYQGLTCTQTLSLLPNMVSLEAPYFRAKDLFSLNRYVLKLAHLTIKQHRSFLTDQIWSRQKLLTDLYLNSITLTKYGLVRGSLLSYQGLTCTQTLSLLPNMVLLEAPYFRAKDLFSLNRYVLKLAHLTIKQHRSFLTDQIWSRRKCLA